ncbi:MAG: 23S rRNA (adenine(2503)-C(2))-methyltransferase RlmN, partial [Gemmatimonadaceae bacterium]
MSLPMSPSAVESSNPKTNLLNLTPQRAAAVLQAFMAARGEPGYRVQQIVARLWLSPVTVFDEITTLSRELRAALDEHFELPRLELATRQHSSDGTEKFLFRLHDGQAIETVAIPDGD